ncbi:MAG: CCA tRNA nucleotidyltransferase [Cyanobacteria bacterium P01_A01_bin.45]
MRKPILTNILPENYPFDLDFLPSSSFVVGGAVRDALLGREREYLDLDFVVGENAVETAHKIAKHYQAGFVLLDSERQIARVVFPHATVDIAQQEGENLETDLGRRDFTINAIAYNPRTKNIIDPLQGCQDLERGLIKMISRKNLQDDPLRLLRGYRQASQLNFEIDDHTQETISSLSFLIQQVALERVRVEVSYMLNSVNGTVWLQKACTSGLLAFFFHNATPEGISRLAKVDSAVSIIKQKWQQLYIKLHQPIRNTIKTTWLGIAKIACLVSQNPEIAEAQLQEITYSKAEINSVTTALKNFSELHKPQISLREQYFFFKAVGDVFPTTAILSLAHDNKVDAIEGAIASYLNPDDLVAHTTPLVSGKDIIISLNIPSSPQIGKILTEIAIAQVEGRVSTASQAIEYARKLIKV